ncbi:MAG: hypothetical protein NWF14_03365, partial [Candidatus Bathyarchaeota archaeon]|nr:hypothetical protein [Candidatus Bathyarchaeota archaeon]
MTENTSITLTYKKPDGSMLDRTVTTGSGGSYVDYYKPDTAGSWSVTATWHGDSAFEGASSLPISFTITDGGPSTPAPIGFEVI